MHAAVLLAHGNNDNNVMTKNATAFYEAVKQAGLPHQFFFHQGGHGGAPPDVMVNRWFTQVPLRLRTTASRACRSRGSCAPRPAPARRASRRSPRPRRTSTTITVADASVFPLGFTLTIPQATREPGHARDHQHRRQHADARDRRDRWPTARTVSLVCGNANPTPYAEWPDPTAQTVTQKLTPGAPGRGGLGFNALGAGNETLTDNATITATTSMNAATSGTRLVYQTNATTQPVRISGTPWLNLRIAFSKAEGEPDRHPDQLPGDGRQRDDPVARLAGPGEPRVDVPERPDHARASSTTCASTCSPRTWSSPPGAGWRSWSSRATTSTRCGPPRARS